jgi:hypothetical protein
MHNTPYSGRALKKPAADRLVSQEPGMRSLRKSKASPSLSDVIAIAGYGSLAAGLFLLLETLVAMGRTQYPGAVQPTGFAPLRYFIYAFESSLFFRYALILMLFGMVMVLMGHFTGSRGKKHNRKG